MRLIDADALNREIDKVECYSRDPYVTYMSECIANAPTVYAVPVRHGKWKKTSCKWVTYECSECGERTDETVMGEPRYAYCPMCGARMVKDDQID